MSEQVMYIVWCRSPYGVDFISLWDDNTCAEKEASSLNQRDFDAYYYVTSEKVSNEVH
jgi:hypothetical protein